MNWMEEEMNHDFKKDIQNGKIWGLKLIRSPIAVIEDNHYADIFNVAREIVGCDEEKFYLRTRRNKPKYIDYKNYEYQAPIGSNPTDNWVDYEGYFGAFDFYDGNILRASVKDDDIPICTEYEVIHAY